MKLPLDLLDGGIEPPVAHAQRIIGESLKNARGDRPIAPRGLDGRHDLVHLLQTPPRIDHAGSSLRTDLKPAYHHRTATQRVISA